MSHTSGSLVYWNAHTGFGEIDLDNKDRRIGVYRADLLRAGVRRPRVGDHFYFNTGTAANGAMAAMDLYPDVGEPMCRVETSYSRKLVTG
jgi:hypothetical protein